MDASDFHALLTMPPQWERRPEAWQALTRGDTLFCALRVAGQSRGLDQAQALLEEWHSGYVASASPAVQHQWQVARALLTCAQIAGLTGETTARLPGLLRALDPSADLPDGLACQAASLEPTRWRAFVQECLSQVTWPSPLSPPAAWDAVAAFQGQSRPVARREQITVLLVAAGNGVTAGLALERLGDDGQGAFYPDPTAMAFVDLDAEFQQGIQNALDWARTRGLWPGASAFDVRWRLTCRDGGILSGVRGGSAGAAFTLGLARLLAAPEPPTSAPGWMAHLSALELARVTITAAVGADARLAPVEGLWPKLLAAARHAAEMGVLRTVVVAQGQAGVPPALTAPNASPLRVLQAENLPAAIEGLYAEHGPRFTVREHARRTCAGLEILGKAQPVPLEQYYQVLPLLQEVERERLPREPQEPDEDREPREPDENRGPSGLRAAELLRWEEAMREEAVTYRAVPLKEVLQNFQTVVSKARSPVPRFVVLGPPGSGKTTLTQYLARQVAIGALQVNGRTLLPVRVRLREWEAWAVKPADPEGSLAEYLAELHKDLHPAPTAEQWRTWLRRGEVLLLLDGLDELRGNPAFPQALSAALAAFADCPAVITCRTVSFEQHQALCPGFPVFTLAGLDDSQRDAYIRAYPADHPDRFDREALIRQLNAAPTMRPLAANPLLLSILCYVVDDPWGVRLPATRGKLYEQAVKKLLDRPRRVEVAYPGGRDLPLARKRRILERAALALFAGLGRQRQLLFSQDALLTALTQAAEAEGYRADPAPVADALLEDLTQNSGLLRGMPEAGYFFLHLTLHEFLAAAHLARLINEGGWDALAPIPGPSPAASGRGREVAPVPGRRVTVGELVDRKAWDPAWQEVITLLAGRLADPGPLLQLLADEKRDDYFRHRLALAALCLPELPHATRNTQHEHIDSITTAAFTRWWEHHLQDTLAAVPHLTRALPALAQVNGRLEGIPLLDWLAGRLADPQEYVREEAAWVVRVLGPAAATPPILERLTALLADADVRWAAAWAVGGLGPAAATPAILERLATLLADPQEYVREAAAWVVRVLGPAAATPQFLERLATLLADPQEYVRDAAIKAVRELGASAATPLILERLAGLLADPQEYVREEAAWVVRVLGPAAATPQFLERLATLLADPQEYVRDAAIKAVGWLGASAATPLILERLAGLLADPEWYVRWAAAQAVGWLGAAAATPLILERLAGLLADPDWDMQKMAAGAVGGLGAAAATPDFLERLAELLADPNWNVRWAAVGAVWGLGPAAATPAFLERLGELLADPEKDVWETAVEVMKKLGPAAATPAILERLVGLLADPDRDVRWAAAWAVGELGPAAATPPILERLTALLADADVRWAAAWAVGGLGPVAATLQILERLADLLADPYVRDRAVEAVGGLGATAATPPILERLAGLLAHPEWYVRRAAARAVGELRPAAATPQFLERLAMLLADPQEYVREAAAWVVRVLGPAAATPQFLERLATLLADPQEYVREEAAWVVRVLGPAAATPLILERLGELLADPNWNVQWAAVGAVGELGAAAATPAFLERLAGLLAHRDEGVRGAAAQAVGWLGPAAATPQFLERLADLLADPYVRDAAIEAVGWLGAAAATPLILERLATLLADPDWDMRKTAAGAVGGLGPAAATPPILERLAGLLADPEGRVRQVATEAVGRLGPAAATPPILERLVGLLADPDPNVQRSAAEAMGKLQAQGVRIFQKRGEWLARRVEELAGE